MTALAEPVVKEPEKVQHKYPRYHVILLDDEDHTIKYIIHMIQELFGRSKQDAEKLVDELEQEERVILLTTTQEHAELKRDQIHAYGKDDRVKGCKGSMSSVIEPAE